MKPGKVMYWLLAVALCLFTVAAIAQETSETSVTRELGVQEAQVEKGEVIYVSGNDLVVKMQDGAVRHITVPDSATAIVNGKEITIKDVKPGMVLQRTITTTTTPEVVKTVRTVEGKVWHVNAPATVILTLADGKNKQYKVPKDQKFMIDGEEKSVWDLKKGMKVKATVVTTVPQTIVAQEKAVTGKMPPPPPTPPVEGALLVEEPSRAPVLQEAAMKTELPKTGSLIPLIGLLGVLSLAGSFGLKLFRSIVS